MTPPVDLSLRVEHAAGRGEGVQAIPGGAPAGQAAPGSRQGPAPHLCHRSSGGRGTNHLRAAQLGHSNPATTLRHYAHWIPRGDKARIDLLAEARGCARGGKREGIVEGGRAWEEQGGEDG